MSFQKSGQKIFMILPKNSYTIIFATFAKTPQGVSSTIHHLIHAEGRKRMWKVVKKTPAMRPSTTWMLPVSRSRQQRLGGWWIVNIVSIFSHPSPRQFTTYQYWTVIFQNKTPIFSWKILQISRISVQISIFPWGASQKPGLSPQKPTHQWRTLVPPTITWPPTSTFCVGARIMTLAPTPTKGETRSNTKGIRA